MAGKQHRAPRRSAYYTLASTQVKPSSLLYSLAEASTPSHYDVTSLPHICIPPANNNLNMLIGSDSVECPDMSFNTKLHRCQRILVAYDNPGGGVLLCLLRRLLMFPPV